MPPHHVEDAVLERGSQEGDVKLAHTHACTKKNKKKLKNRTKKWHALIITMGGAEFGGRGVELNGEMCGGSQVTVTDSACQRLCAGCRLEGGCWMLLNTHARAHTRTECVLACVFTWRLQSCPQRHYIKPASVRRGKRCS